ncbi:aldo/keto reductase [Gangjinia marincola]
MSLEKYYVLGKTGLRVSRLALGTMTFGEDWGWGSEKKAAKAIFDYYIDKGGNFIDTADLYTDGNSEKMVGEFVKDRKLREKVVIATKFSYNGDPGNPNGGGNSRKHIVHAVEGSLKRLQTDYIDLYFLHTYDLLTKPEEVMRTLDDLVKQGKILHIGLSDCPSWYVSRAQTIAEYRGFEPVSTMQLEYSLVERNIEKEFIPLGQETGIGTMVWSPLASGLLSGKYKPSESGIEGEGRLKTMEGSDNKAFDKNTERNWKIVSALEEVAKEIEQPMASVALNWVANRPGISSVIVGATKMHQLEENLASLDFDIPHDLKQKLKDASKPSMEFPYSFFEPKMQAMLTGGAKVGHKPASYWSDVSLEEKPAGV